MRQVRLDMAINHCLGGFIAYLARATALTAVTSSIAGAGTGGLRLPEKCGGISTGTGCW